MLTTVFASMVSVWLINGLMLLMAGVFHAPLTHLIETARLHRVRKLYGRVSGLEGIVVPLPALSGVQLIMVALVSGGLSSLIIAQMAGSVWSSVLAIPITIGIAWIILNVMEFRQTRRMSEQVVDAATQVGSLMNGGVTLLNAIKQVGEGLHEPLATPWQWMTNTAGTAVYDPETGERRFTTLGSTAMTVGGQTTCKDLIRFLEHIEGSEDLPQASARDRMLAASIALQETRLREKGVRSKLAHARVSSFAVVGVGLGIAIFLRFTMAERWDAAFSGPFALPAILFFCLVYIAPIGAAIKLSQVPNVDF